MFLSFKLFDFFVVIALIGDDLLLLLLELVAHIVLLGAKYLLVLTFFQDTNCVQHI